MALGEKCLARGGALGAKAEFLECLLLVQFGPKGGLVKYYSPQKLAASLAA